MGLILEVMNDKWTKLQIDKPTDRKTDGHEYYYIHNDVLNKKIVNVATLHYQLVLSLDLHYPYRLPHLQVIASRRSDTIEDKLITLF